MTSNKSTDSGIEHVQVSKHVVGSINYSPMYSVGLSKKMFDKLKEETENNYAPDWRYMGRKAGGACPHIVATAEIEWFKSTAKDIA